MPEEPPADTVDRGQTALRHYLTIFRRRRLPIVIGVVVPILLAIVYSAFQTPQYEGSAKVILNRQSLANALTDTPDPTAQANDYIRIVQTQAELARSPSVADRALQGLAVSMTPSQFLAASSVEPGRDADVLEFRVRHGNQRTAQQLTNSYARAYVHYRLQIDTAALRQATDEVDKRIQELQRDATANARLIQSLQGRAQELETLQALQVAKATVVYDPDAAAQVAPTWARNIVLGTLAGLVLALGVAALLESLDTRIRDEREIGDHLQGTLLARLGPPPDPEAPLVMLTNPSSVEAEMFRVFETNLRFAMIDRSIKSLMVTSSLQSEGKSTTIGNLAVAMARSGRDVILVDLDLRRSTVRTMFDLKAGPGITDLLLGGYEFESALVTADLGDEVTTGGRLRLLPAGTPPPNPGELLSPNGEIAKLIAALGSEADIVLVDAPPALLVGDAVALTAIVDGIFSVVRLGVATRAMLDDLDRTLRGGGAQVVGFVATGRSANNGGYGYGYGYSLAAQEAGGDPLSATTEPMGSARA